MPELRQRQRQVSRDTANAFAATAPPEVIYPWRSSLYAPATTSSFSTVAASARLLALDTERALSVRPCDSDRPLVF